jgi:predicted permease
MFQHKRKPDDFNAEVEAHLELETHRLKEQGMSETEARAAAHRAFGNVTRAEERFYESGRWIWWDHVAQDVRFGLRQLRKNPGFTAVAVLTLALGIGANVAIFSVVEAVFFRSLPVAAPQQLVSLTDPDSHGRSYGNEGGTRSLLAYWEFEYLRDHTDVFSGMFAADSFLPEREARIMDQPQGRGSELERVRVRLVSGGYFSTLGVRAAAGRTFAAEADRARGAFPVAVISYAFWKQRFGLDPSILGKTIQVRETPFEIIGVAPPGFFGETVGDAADMWVPLTMQSAIYPGRDLLSPVAAMMNEYIWLHVMARLKPGVSITQANAAVAVVFKRMLESAVGPGLTQGQIRGYYDQRIELQAGARGSSSVHEPFSEPLQILMGLVALILLIACANIANLMLARGSARQKEFAVRVAIGAGRSRLIRQLLVESLLLAFFGAALGLVVAQWANAALVRMASGVSSGPAAIRLDLRPDAQMLGFTLGVAVLTAILFGLAPALLATRPEITSALKSAPADWTAKRTRFRLSLGSLLVSAQVAFSMILLVAAGLFVHSLTRLGEVSLGYDRESLLVFAVDAAPAGLTGPALIQFQNGLLDKFSAIPGVRRATLSSNGLFQHSDSGDEIAVEGYTPKGGEEIHSRMDHVGPSYFSVLGIPILLGREIGAGDTSSAPRVAVVNQAFARQFFPNANPLGKHVRDTFPGNPGEMEIVGVAANVKSNNLREQERSRIYMPAFNPLWEHQAVSYEIRTFADPGGVGKAIRKAVEETNSAIPPIKIETLTGLIDDSLQTDQFIARLSGAFGLLAILLASVGLYGVMAYNVARRTRDIGVRMALGARTANVLWLVLGESLMLVGVGIGCGVPLALGGTRLIRNMLFGVGVADPVALASAAVMLAAVALLAGLVPARRATQVDPVVALRYE